MRPTPLARSTLLTAALRQILLLLLAWCGCARFEVAAQDRESLAGEQTAHRMKESAKAQAEQYRIHYGPFAFQVQSGVAFGYTDNAYYSQTNRRNDFLVLPELNLTGFMQVSELNTLRLTAGLGYEYYSKNTELNADAPLVNPNTELTFNLFVQNFRIRLHERFSYEETLFINTTPGGQDLLFNFSNTGTFSRWDNLAGFFVDWDLNKVILSVGYDHENFVSTTAAFDYLTRASELFTASASYLAGDHVTFGAESQAGYHNFKQETTMNDHWQVRAGPFAEVQLPESITLRGGGGYDTARYDSLGAGSDFETYYAYGRVTQQTRLFTHSLSAGHEHLLGDNANNLETTYVRYAISTDLLEHWEPGIYGSWHMDKEFGGGYLENFTYYIVGARVGYQFHKYWRTDLSYEYMLKNSDLAFRGFYRNRVTLGVTFTF